MRSILEDYTIAFDLDGTLIDTAPDLVRSTNVIMDILDLPHCDLNDMRKIVGRGAKAAVVTAAGLGGRELNDDEVAPLLKIFLEDYEAGIANLSRPYDGVAKFLHEMEGAKAKLVVCTNKPTHLANKVLKELEVAKFFLGVYGADSAPKNKPDPIHLTTSINGIGGDLNRAIMIGDSENDVLAARAANIPVLVTSFGYTTTAAKDLMADGIFDHYDELADQIIGLLRNKAPIPLD